MYATRNYAEVYADQVYADMVILNDNRPRPEITPFDRQQDTVDAVAARMQAMLTSDVAERVRLFSSLRAVPDGLLERAWRIGRMRQPPLGWESDCLERVDVEVPTEPIQCRRAVVTVATPGYEPLLATLVDSLAPALSPDDAVVVFAVGTTYDWLQANYPQNNYPHITAVRCAAAGPLSAAVKGVLYSCARWIDAAQIIAVECDMLVLSPLAALWQVLDGLHPEVMAGCRSQVRGERFRLADVFGHMSCPLTDWEWLTGESTFPTGRFCFNGGLLAGGRAAWLKLDAAIRRMGPRAVLWTEGAFYESFRDELLMNLCLAEGGDTAELPPCWNVQLCDGSRDHWVQTTRAKGGMHYTRLGETARVLHFVGAQRPFLSVIAAEVETHGLSAAHALD